MSAPGSSTASAWEDSAATAPRRRFQRVVGVGPLAYRFTFRASQALRLSAVRPRRVVHSLKTGLSPPVWAA